MISDWSKYYTPQKIAEEIIHEFPKQFVPKTVIDICVGCGNFLSASKDKWPNAELIGCDINLDFVIKKTSFSLHKLNALDVPLLHKTLEKKIIAPKLILANPPFGKYKSSLKTKSENIIATQANRLNRIEAFMLLSNLSLLNKGDYFGAILPENFFTSTKFDLFKREFLSRFEIIKIGQPLKYFDKSEVRTRIFIGKFLEHKQIVTTVKTKIRQKLSVYNIFRGVDNSLLKKMNKKSSGSIEVLHFNVDILNINSRFQIKEKLKYNRLKTKTNDLIILRVGRNAGRCFLINKENANKLISDHFYIVKNHNFCKSIVESIEVSLINKRKGITTKYICKSDIDNTLEALQDLL